MHRRIIAAQTTALEARDAVRTLFTGLALRGAPTEFIVEQVGLTLAAPVVLETVAHEVVVAHVVELKPAQIAPALAGGFADSKPLQILAPQMAASQFEPIKWHVRTLLKDLDTAVKLSREQGSATPMSGLAAQLMRLHGSQGFLERDPATLVELLREQCP